MKGRMPSHIPWGYLCLTSIGLVMGCAQISIPTGGAKDTAPPVPLVVDPPSGTRNWKPGTLRVTWDEFVEVKDAKEFSAYDLMQREKLIIDEAALDLIEKRLTGTVREKKSDEA